LADFRRTSTGDFCSAIRIFVPMAAILPPQFWVGSQSLDSVKDLAENGMLTAPGITDPSKPTV
jgi:hypothetical protein